MVVRPSCPLAQCLSLIYHERATAHECCNEHGWQCAAWVGGEVAGCDALLVVVFEEGKHVGRYVVGGLPAVGEHGCALAADDATQGVVESDFVVEVVEVSFVDEAPVEVGVIYFGYEDDAWVFRLDLADGPCPEGAWHHLGHVAAEAVDAACGPEAEDVEHLVPG